MDNTTKARILRKNQTDAEAVLWRKLRGRGLENYKFRRQVPVGPYVADFLCKEVEYDQYRDAFLRASGYEVLRFWNNEVMNVNGVLASVTLTLFQRARELKERRS